MGSVIEKAAGYKENVSGKKEYLGSPMKLLLRYRFDAGKRMSWSYTAEKDAGEPVF